MFDLIIEQGHLFGEDLGEGTPASGARGGPTPGRIADVALLDGKIAEVAGRISGRARRRLDARGLAVLPGLIDPHVHLGLPAGDAVSCDDVGSGTRSALHGGVTTVIDFSLQRQGQLAEEAVDSRIEEFRGRSHCDYALHANLTDFSRPPRLEALAERGCTSVKIFTAYGRRGMRIPAGDIEGVLRRAAACGFTVLVHAEDDGCIEAATAALEAVFASAAREGPASPGGGGIPPAHFAATRPAEAEIVAIREVTEAAIRAGAPLYIVHVSTGRGLGVISEARRRSRAPILAETCPHYLLLDDGLYGKPDGHRYIVTPPLRDPRDREELRQGVLSGAVDVVATDHCPFRLADTARPGVSCTQLPSGLPGIETRLPLMLHLLEAAASRGGGAGLPPAFPATMSAAASGRSGVDDPPVSGPAPEVAEPSGYNQARVAALGSAAALLATNPARIFGLYPRKGVIRRGSDGDLVLLDPAARFTIRAQELHGKADHTPFEGHEGRGRVVCVILRGQVELEERSATAAPRGRYIPRSTPTRAV